MEGAAAQPQADRRGAAGGSSEGPRDAAAPPGEPSKDGPVNRKRDWQQKYQNDVSRRAYDEPDAAEAMAVEALKSAKVARVGSGEFGSGRFGKARRGPESPGSPAVLRPAAIHAKSIGDGGAGTAFPVPTAAGGMHGTAQHARGFAPPSNKGYMEELLAHIQPAGRVPAQDAAEEKAGDAAEYELSADCLGSRKARHTRRGPMDEMRQLVRILVKIVPQSLPHLATTEDGGGNRISEEQIKYYLDKTLGQAPRPDWGLPRGWGQYLAVLFEWATNRPFSEDEARQCAKRLPGRSWEAVESALEQFCLRPHTWRLPLQRGPEGVDGLWLLTDDSKAAAKPVVEEEQVKAPKKPRMALPNLSKADTLPEVDVWKLALHLVKIAVTKHGTTPAHLRDALQAIKREVRETVENSLAVPAGPLASPMPAASAAGAAPHLLSSSHMLSGINSIDLQSLLGSHGGGGLQLAQLHQQHAQQTHSVSGLHLASLPRSGAMLSASNLSNLTPQALGSLAALQGPAGNLLLNRQVVLPSSQGAFTQVHPQQPQGHGGPPAQGQPPCQPATSNGPGHAATQPPSVKPEGGAGAAEQQQERQGAAPSSSQAQSHFGVNLLGGGGGSAQRSTHLTADISTGGLMPLLNYSCYGANPALAPEGEHKAGADATQQQQQQQQHGNLSLAGLYGNQYRGGGFPSLQLAGNQLVYHTDLGSQLQQVQGLGQLQGLSQLQAQNPMGMLGSQPVLLALHQHGLSFGGSQMAGNGMGAGAPQGQQQQGVQQLMTIPAATNPA